jgi:IS30 family transposase
VSAEAIYHSLYVQGKGGLRAELTQHLKLKRQARKHESGRGRLPDTLHISQRPAEARDRALPGHWEGDLLLGKGGSSQVGMLAERTTRYTLLFALPNDRTAPTVRDALVEVVRTLPEHLRRSLTWDNGKEMAEHRAFTLATDLQVYFCDPGSPWQRGTAENTIGLVRAYLPKGEDLSGYSARQLAEFAVMLNERPRKTLGWRSPARAYAELLAVQ